MRHILPLLVALFPISSDAWAWGDEGHKVIREIALRLVQPGTRATTPSMSDYRLDEVEKPERHPDAVRRLSEAGRIPSLAESRAGTPSVWQAARFRA
jgi:hypothetical protein